MKGKKKVSTKKTRFYRIDSKIEISSDVLSERRRSVSAERRKIKLDSKLIKFKFFEKQKSESEITVSKSLHEPRGINCSFCYENIEEALKFRSNQIRSFTRQSNRLDSKALTIGKS